MSQITDFFTKNGTDDSGRDLQNMLDMSDSQLEATHDCIQWIFPLHEKSYHSRSSPVLSQEDIEILKSNDDAVENMKMLLKRFSMFLGVMEYEDKNKHYFWAHTGNHNLLRITRAIRSLRIFGLDKEASDFHAEVTKVAKINQVHNSTFEYWDDALNKDINCSMTDKFLEDRRIEL